jgi:gliding motility-associated-like protein
MDCYNLTGPYTVTFRTDPPGVAEIKVNTITFGPTALPYTGTYYGNITTDLKTKPTNPDYEFVNWQIINTVTPTVDSAKVSTMFSTSQEVVAVYKIPTTLFIPTAFSPNGDGINDDFKVLGKGILKVTLDIFDRWGEKMFGTTDKDLGWDGTYKGKKCMPAVYAYRAYVEYVDGTNKVEKGNVTLVR